MQAIFHEGLMEGFLPQVILAAAGFTRLGLHRRDVCAPGYQSQGRFWRSPRLR